MSKTFLSPKERRALLLLSLIIIVVISAWFVRTRVPDQNHAQQIVVQLPDRGSLTTDSLARIDKQQKEAKSKRKNKQSKGGKKSTYKERKPLEDIVPGK